MGRLKTDLMELRQLLHPVLVEVEMAIDTETYPDWTEVKEKIVQALEVVRKLERDQLWRALKK
ncbi:MAG TPA: hypothetical protein VNM72_07850 [Blastocatellia bacterium]|nr:hypothetical protein [Blastocatellia bacterium]